MGRLWCPDHPQPEPLPAAQGLELLVTSWMATRPLAGPITTPAMAGCGDGTLPMRALPCQAGVPLAAGSLLGLPAPQHKCAAFR